jgi:trigger factor
MLVRIEDKSGIEKQLFFSVTQSQVDESINSFIKEIAPRVEARGFRKGTAPPAVIRNQFKDIILAECSARIVHEEVSGSIREKQLKIVGSPSLIEAHRASRRKKYVGEFNLDGSFEFAVIADFEPELQVVIPPELHISEALPTLDSLVAADLEKIRASMAQLDFVERPAEASDQVSVEFLDGSNSHASVALSDTPDTFVDNTVFLDKKAGDEFDAALKDGRVIRVRLSAVFARALPALDDEFAKSALFSSLEDMKRDLISKKTNDHSVPLKAKLYNEVLTQLIEANPLEIPDRWIDAETEVICRRIGLKALPKDSEQLVQQLKQQARRNILSNIFLDAIYRERENIHMSADEAFGVVEAEAQKVGRTPDEVLTHLRNSGQYELLMSFHERNRAIDFLISQAKVK